MIITTAEDLRRLVEYYQQFDSLVFDLETVYNGTAEEEERAEEIRSRRTADRSVDDTKWLEVYDLKATDSVVNETIWIGMATCGRSDAVAVGHPLGSMIAPAHTVIKPASEVFDEDDPRRYSNTGKVSHRKIEVKVPARFSPAPPQLDPVEAWDILRPLFFDPDRRIINQNIKFDTRSSVKYLGGDFIPGPYGETMVAQQLLDENLVVKYDLGGLVEKHLGHTYSKLGSKGVHRFSFEEAARYAEQDAKFTWLLWQKYERLLKKHGLWDLLEFEMQVLPVLMRKEHHGALVDRNMLRVLRSRMEGQRDEIMQTLISEHGISPSFNFNSNPQKQELFFKKLKAKPHKTTGSGAASVDAESLEAIASQGGPAGEVAKLFLQYGEVEKMIGTYCIGLGFKLDASSRLHPSFTQHQADTGRLSCVSGDTPVLTKRGMVPIVDVVVGDMVMTHRGRWRSVTAHLDQGVRGTVWVQTEHGVAVRCTQDHRLHGPDGWVYVHDLEVGQELHSASIQPWDAGCVTSITPGGLCQVYDLTVEEDHSFVAGGFVHHNCTNPNLHNIPRDSDMRDLFVAPKGQVIIGVDYDQIELRFICTWAQDRAMQKVFLSGEDVHGTTAALVLNKPLEEVTSEERTIFGKMPNFLIGYGGTHYLLAAKTGISNEQAESVFQSYFGRFRHIQPWKDEELKTARANARFSDGKMVVPPYVETMMGRRRRLPHLAINPKNAPNKDAFREMSKLVGRAERQGINAIIQGSAAETLKLAMIDIQNYIDRDGFPMQLVLNVHDELMAYCDEKHADDGLDIIETHMANVVNPVTGEGPLRGYVPLVASGQVSDRWVKG